MKANRTNRKVSVVMIIMFAGFIISCSAVIILQDQISVLQNENARLTNENARLRDDDAELQKSVNTLPVIQPFIQIGRDYLDSLDKPTGKILSIRLEEKAPILYWHNYTDEDIAQAKETGEILHPYVLGEPRLCWVIKFEQANRPGHSFEVWIDASTSDIIRMKQCRAGYDGVKVTNFYH